MKRRPVRPLATLSALAFVAVAVAADLPTVTNAWSRATAPGVDVGAAYMTIQGGSKDDRLVAASTERAAMVHLHAVEESDGIARMRAVEGIDVAAGRKVELAPKGMHIMLMGLSGPLVAGESYALTLEFAKAGDLTVQVKVRAAGAEDDAGPAPH